MSGHGESVRLGKGKGLGVRDPVYYVHGKNATEAPRTANSSGPGLRKSRRLM